MTTGSDTALPLNSLQHLFICPKAEMLPRWRQAFPQAACANAASAIEGVPPEVMWLRLDPGAPVAEQLAQARDRYGAAALVVMSDQPTDAEAMAALSAGAKAYCNSHAAPELLRQIAAVVEQGGLWIGEGLMQKLLSLANRVAVPSANRAWEAVLSERERDVAREISTGISNKEVARRLGITERTVKMHLSAIFAKLKVRDRLQLSLMIKS